MPGTCAKLKRATGQKLRKEAQTSDRMCLGSKGRVKIRLGLVLGLS